MKDEILKQRFRESKLPSCYRTQRGIYCLEALHIFHGNDEFDAVLIYGEAEGFCLLCM